MSQLTNTALAVQIAIAKARVALLKASFGSVNRWPAGSSKGGQFAPKGGAGITAPQLGLGGGNSFQEAGWAGSGMWKPAAPPAPPAGAKPHPKTDDKGKPVTINYPTPASPPSTWSNHNAVATFTPGGKVPEVLNGVPFKPWNPPQDGWAKVSGTNEKLDESLPFEPHPTKKTAAGVLIMEPDGRVWLTRPTNAFGGYQHTYPKGTAEDGLTLQQNAIKEAWEETGLKVKIVGVLGDFERDTSKARYYIARRVGGTPKDMGWESQALRLSPQKQARELLNKPHDKDILDDFFAEMSFGKAKSAGPNKADSTGKSGHWQFQERWKAGTPLGGQWMAMGADGITAPPKIAGGLTGSNSIYQKAANAAHDAAQSGDNAALNAVIDKYGPSALKYANNEKSSSHVKWGAQVHQYVTQVKADTKAKTIATTVADKLQGPPKLADMTHIGPKPGGSNPGAMYSDAEGKWLVKGSNASDATPRSQNEVLASKLMAAVGAGAPEMKLVDLQGQHGGGIGVASKWIDGGEKFNPGNPAHLAAAQADFAVHAWLANYDVLGMGMDNTKIIGGKAVNIDPGGAILYRAQGAPKGDTFGNKATEFDSLREKVPGVPDNPNAWSVYGKMTASQIASSAEKLKAIDDATIGKMVQAYGPGDDYAKGVLTSKLIARKNDILARAAAMQPAPVAPPKPAAAAPAAPPAAPVPAAATPSLAALHQTAFQLAPVWSSGIKDLHAENDVRGLKEYIDDFSQFKNAEKKDALTAYAQAAINDIQSKAVPAAPAAAPAAPSAPIEKPKDWPHPGTADYYNGLVSAAEKAHASGDLAALKALALNKKGAAAWPAKTGNGKLMNEFHTKLVVDLEKKQAAQVMATVQAAQAAVSTPPPVIPKPTEKAPGAAGAMPDFGKFKLPASNSNAASHNGKVDQIADLAAKGDVKGLLSLNYGTNTYGKQQAKLANDALKALGSTHGVVAGQKKNANPALTGGLSPATVAGASATTGQPNPIATAPAAPAAPKPAPQFKADQLSSPPNFNTMKDGGPLSSVAAVNESNNAAVALVHKTALQGNLDAIKSLTYEVLDKQTGKPTGVFKGMAEHPSQHVRAYWQNLVDQIDLQLNPPRIPRLGVSATGKTLAEAAAKIKPIPHGKAIAAIPKSQKAGFYIINGQIDPTLVNIKSGNTAVDQPEWKKNAAKAYTNAPSAAQASFSTYVTTSGAAALNTALRTGSDTTFGGKKVSQYVKDFEGLLVDIPEGTTFVRNMGSKGYGTKPPDKDEIVKLQQFLMNAPKGTVLQEPGFSSSSYTGASSILGNNDIQWNFTAGPGVKAFPAWLSANTGEGESLFPPNTQYVIRGAKKVGKTVVVDAILLPHPPGP